MLTPEEIIVTLTTKNLQLEIERDAYIKLLEEEKNESRRYLSYLRDISKTLNYDGHFGNIVNIIDEKLKALSNSNS